MEKYVKINLEQFYIVYRCNSLSCPPGRLNRFGGQGGFGYLYFQYRFSVSWKTVNNAKMENAEFGLCTRLDSNPHWTQG